MTEVIEKAHAEFSASGSQKWLACPGSIALCKTAPEAPESRYAEEGTQAHSCLEYLLLGKDPADAEMLYGQEMAEHAKFAADWILARHKAAAKRGPATLLAETRVDASPFTCTGQFGTLDAAIVEEFGRLVVIDYKFGFGVVDPVDDEGNLNSQLVYYALGISYQYHHNFTDVELVIIQPRAYHPTGDTVRSVVVPMADLLAWAPKFREGVMATGAKNAPLNAGSWCKFCQAATICPEIKVKAFKAAQIVFSDEKGIESMPEPSMVPIPHLGTILGACDKLEAWIKKVREHAEYALSKGRPVPGFKLVQKRGQRKWINAEQAEADAVRDFQSPDIFSPAKLLSPAQLEKITGKEWVDARTTTESSGTTIAKESDKRPAVISAEAVFAAVPLLESTRKRTRK